MFELSQTFYFEAAHTLERRYETESSRRIHGHTYGAEVQVQGEPDAASGMVVDLAHLRAVIEQVRSQLDHHFLDDVPDGAASAVADAWIAAEAYRLYTWGTVTRLAGGGDMGTAGSVNKVFWSELDIALNETALELLGTEAEVESRWTDAHLFSLSGPIYAGTNEIQRNIIAERILGLPREPKVGR